MGDACGRCGGKGEYPAKAGDYSKWITCKFCKGSGRNGPRDLNR